MAHRFNGGRPGYFTCDRAGCRSGRINWNKGVVVGPLIRECKAYEEVHGHWPEGWEKRRDYCSVECLELAEAGKFAPLPHHKACLTVTKWRYGELVPTVICCDECQCKDGPTRYVRVEKAKTNNERRKGRSKPTATRSSAGRASL